MLTEEQKHDIGDYVRKILSSGIVDKKVCDTPLEAWDVVNKRFAYATASAPCLNTTVAATYSPTLVPISTPTFLNGITYLSGSGFSVQVSGQYLVMGQAYFSPTQTGTCEAMIYVNGIQRAIGYAYCSSAYLFTVPFVAQILNLNAGDNVQLYAAFSNSSTQTVTGANSYLSIAKV